MKINDKSHKGLIVEVEKLRNQLAEAEETLRAIRSGEVDALVVSGEKGEQVFTLKGAEQPYRILIEEMSEGAVMLAADDSILYCNRGFAAMLKMPLEKLMGTAIEHHIAPSNEALFLELLREGREKGSSGEIILLAGDRTFVSAQLSFNTLQMDDGRLVYLVATDLTDQKRIQDELRRARDELEIRVEERTAELAESEQRWATTLASIGDAVISTDVEGCITFMNPVAETLTGWTLAEASTKPVTEIFNIINEYTRAGVEDPVSKVLKEGMVVGLANHTILVRKDGTEVPIDDSGAPIRDQDGTNMGVVLIFRDITERKLAEETLRKVHDELEQRVQERTVKLKEANKALQESEASYRELTESINDLFFAMDKDLRYIYWNKASETLTGILAKDAIGKSIYELFPDVKGTKAKQFYDEALKTQQPQRFESQFQIGGNKYIFEINAYPTKNGISVIAKDISEKKKLEMQLLRSQRMESIGTLAGGIAHDLNNMLTPIMLSLQMLKEKHKDEQSQKLLTILEKNSMRGANLIKQILTFSRGVEGERKPIQIMDHISEIETVLKETFPRNIEIRIDPQKDLFTISGDATQLYQVIMNLCVNARDAMPSGGILNIMASNFFIDENYALKHTEAKVGQYVVIAVSDTGIGIPHKIVDRIFEPFFTTKEFGNGTGLGLSTALAIVKSHGGFITVYSEVGEGTTFRVYLPSINTELQIVKEELFELAVGNGELVLVAEDEDSIREITVSTLESYGYKVLTASDGADAVALYAQNKDKIEVILMDMMMPVMDGHASIRTIRKINPAVKIVAVSGLAEKDKNAKIADIGVHAFLPKPYTAGRLLKTIHEILNNIQ